MEKIKCFGFDMDYTLAGECTQPILYIYTNCFCNSSEIVLANLSQNLLYVYIPVLAANIKRYATCRFFFPRLCVFHLLVSG